MQQKCEPTTPAARPTPQFLADARQVVANPELYADRPLLRRLAWAALIADRRRALNQECLAAMPVEQE